MKAIITDLNTGDETLISIRAPKAQEERDTEDVWALREDTINTILRNVYKIAYPERFNARFKLSTPVDTCSCRTVDFDINTEGEVDVLRPFNMT